MNVTYMKATSDDVDTIYELCKQLIVDYEQPESIDFTKVFAWIRKKIENSINDYTAIYVNSQKAGYYHFFKNDDGIFELDDLYIFPEFQNQGLGTAIIQKCCVSVQSPIMLYVFIRNQRAISLYERLGFKITQTISDSRYIMVNSNTKL